MEVRRAFANDISALYAMLREMHSNTELEVSPIDDYKLLNKINEIVHKGLVLVSYEGNEITGSIAGIRISDWWSSEPILSDIWFYVSPLHRKSRSALMLIKAFIKIAKDAKVKIRLGHIYSGDIERKDKFYEKLGLVKAGSTYVEKK
jgi:GNAT superfamily N-acetyltransferase|tara:strand:- start:242 stop:682 length:441 start_codon:yes stop_codon:yes gene_type:complete